MRAIDATLKARIELAQQTLYNNANPQMDVTVTRPRTPITRAGFWQESIVTAGATAVCTSVCVRRQVKHPTRAYVAYVTDGGTLVVKYADLSAAFADLDWITIETIAGCSACALEFNGSFVPAPRGRVEYLTDETPWLFYVTSGGALMAGLLGGAYESLAGANVVALDAIRGVASRYKDEDQGLLLFYVIAGVVYYKAFISGAWSEAYTVAVAPESAVSVKAERVFDWRIVLHITDSGGALFEVFSRMAISGWTQHGTLRPAAASLEAYLTDVNYLDARGSDYLRAASAEHESWNMSIYSPALIAACNIGTSIEDPENPGEFIEDFGYRVVFEFDQIVRNAADFAGDFKLTDDYNMSWYGQAASVNGRFVTVTFANFNNAGSPVLAKALAGNLSNGYTLLTETSVEFEAAGLVPYYVPAPIPQTAWNTDANTIFVTFDLPIIDISAQTGFAVTALEPNMSPGGTLSTKTYGFSAASIEADPHTIKIILTTAGRLKFPQGDVTINFTGAMYGPGNSAVAPFSLSFTPTITAYVFNPNSQSYLHPAAMLLTTSRPAVTYSQYEFRPGEACIRPASATMVATRTHIDDLPE